MTRENKNSNTVLYNLEGFFFNKHEVIVPDRWKDIVVKQTGYPVKIYYGIRHKKLMKVFQVFKLQNFIPGPLHHFDLDWYYHMSLKQTEKSRLKLLLQKPHGI